MAESSNLREKAREILATPSHKELETIVEHLSMRQESEEYRNALAIYDFCVANLANLLTVKLLKVYRYSYNGVVRFRSIYLLSETMAKFRSRGFEFSLVAIYELKPLLISCLIMQETKESDIRIFKRILSFVAYNVVTLDNDGWDELSECISLLADQEPLKALHVFVDLPRVYGDFIFKCLKSVLAKALEGLRKPEESRVEDWTLCLVTFVKMGIQILDSEKRYDYVNKILEVIVKYVSDVTKKGMEQFVQRGLEGLERFLLRDKILYCYCKDQCDFLSAAAFKIQKAAPHAKEVAKRINRLVEYSDNPATKVLGHGAEFDHEWYDHLKNLSAMEVLEIFASDDLEERSRELAIRCLNELLSNYTAKKIDIEISVMRNLPPLLISCLCRQKGISDNMFKVLGEVVNYVANEMFHVQQVSWFGLRDYIAKGSDTKFERAVYIFRCLTMPLEDEEFVVSVTEKLLPEISLRLLNPPRELLMDNKSWVLAFTGAFCAAIHLIEMSSHSSWVKAIANQMIYSVKELVGREMEVGLVRRAFRDVESIVKKQSEWYLISEYKFMKGMLWRLYAIEGMTWESKIVLWRINVIVERKVDVGEKELPKTEFDWVNS